jgi:hypothetical protein
MLGPEDDWREGSGGRTIVVHLIDKQIERQV